MKQSMKNKAFLLTMTLLVSVVSFACSLFAQSESATPTPDYVFEPVTTPLMIEPESLPNAQTGVAYEVEILVSDNVTPVSSVIISNGTLPPGLELVFMDGEDGATISGTPEESGTYTFTVFISCFGTMVGGQTGDKEYTIIVEE